MALNIWINSSAVNSVTRTRTLRITKQGGVEVATLETTDPLFAFRPGVGDVLRVDQDGSLLEFGGEVTRVTERLRKTGASTVIEARGWAFEADEVIVPAYTVPSSMRLTTAAITLTGSILAAKGWSTPGMSSGQGSILAARTYLGYTVKAIFDDWTAQTGQTWRVNGDRWLGYQFPASLVPAPTSFSASNRTVLVGSASWTQDQIRLATRMFATTGGSSADYFAHVEAHQANGVKTVFPVNVIPPEVGVATAAAYAAAVSTIGITGAPASISLRAGLTIRAAAHGPYSLASAAIVNASGEATLALANALTAPVVAEEGLTLDNGTLVGLFINSTATALEGASGWRWEPGEAQFRTSSATPSSSTVVRYTPRVRHPAVVRSWLAGTQLASGAFDYGAIRDVSVARPGDLDLAATHQRNLLDLAERGTLPKSFTVQTDYVGQIYPWMAAACSFPDHDISGTFTVQDVEIVDVGRLNQRPRMQLTMIETGARRDWREPWRTVGAGRTSGVVGVVGAGGGSSGTGGSVAAPYVGLSLPIGGSNIQTLPVTTTWKDISEAVPIDHPSDATGTWEFRPAAYQLSASTPSVPLQLRLLIAGTAVSSLSTWAYGSYTDNSFFGFPTHQYNAPGAGACLVQARVASLTGNAVIGHGRVTKVA
jgi:hypothetical protein